MAPLIDWTTTGQIFVESLAAGVVIVGAFAVGARLLALVTARSGTGGAQAGRGRPGAWAGAILCFLLVAAAVGYGIYFTVDK